MKHHEHTIKNRSEYAHDSFIPIKKQIMLQ